MFENVDNATQIMQKYFKLLVKEVLIKATSCIKNAEDKLVRNNVFAIKFKTQISAKGRVEKE